MGAASKVGHFFGLGEDEFDEDKHPRDADGKFASGGGSAADPEADLSAGKEEAKAPTGAYEKAAAAAAKYIKSDSQRNFRVNDYADLGYHSINEFLKRGRDWSQRTYGGAKTNELEEEAAKLKKDVENGPHFEGTVTRGAYMDQKTVDALVESRSITSNSFWSTSTDQDIAENFAAMRRNNADFPQRIGKTQVLFHISQKAGMPISNAIGNGSDPSDTYEKEVLLPPGVKFKVTKYENGPGKSYAQSKAGFLHVYLEQQ